MAKKLLQLVLVPVFIIGISLFTSIDAVFPNQSSVYAEAVINDGTNRDKTQVLVQPDNQTNFSIFIIIGAVLLLATIIGFVYINFSNKSGNSEQFYRDQKRKFDLERIRYSLSAFAKTYGRYPDASKGEFLELITEMEPFPIDPMADQDVGFNNQKYNYYYDNQSLDAVEKGRPNTAYYRLWCHLEDKNDSDINLLYSKSYKNIYLKTSLDPLNPALLTEPQKKSVTKKAKNTAPTVQNTQNIQQITSKPLAINLMPEKELHRKESLVRFLLILTTVGLLATAIVNGILFYLWRYKQ